ncbi:hypothetical protein [Nocardia seriolae]|uniref:Uncharacterized protein n=1 Tax=Nocardia seriolae TaxID=37332 RepID=A0A0B8NGU4_9NOCA|nr:hypothetical protein [Nocardia seriolae]APA98673.1 hypothetical protein NS506_04625 [Nocardia seriolae]MTJ63749.1 cupin domain-containing protein [Nocardia seriolae]MTJ74024.1 cupin domain-containing protein [Nocardia seriolae]MTJ88313.1 cupin domain-containing protein [Nocardia seriolae]MTK32299.1 cupin domain-containing protein [Nocardia seriolae]
MPRTTKSEAPIAVDADVIEARYVEMGGYTVGFETFKQDFDPAPLFTGLPDDRCQCPHWGLVVSGRLVLRYADHEETFRTGDVYYGAPGHLPLVFAGSEVIEFSPTEAFGQTMSVVERNMQSAAAGS